MFNFKDPAVISYELDLTAEEMDNIGEVNFAEKNFFMSLQPVIDDEKVEEVPAEVGHLSAWLYIGEEEESHKLELKNCTEVISKERQEHWGKEAKYAKCIDPEDWTISAYFDGTYVSERLEVWFGFELCNVWIEGNNCLDDDELQQWFYEHTLSFWQFYPSYSIDWESKHDYWSENLAYIYTDVFMLWEQRLRKSVLRSYEATFEDEWYPILPAKVKEYTTVSESTLLASTGVSNMRDSYYFHPCYLDSKK